MTTETETETDADTDQAHLAADGPNDALPPF
jgi:hypothetical protein